MELGHAADAHLALVTQHDAEDRRGDETGFVHQQVGGGQGGQHRGEDERVLEVVGHQVAAQHLDHDQPGDHSDDRTDGGGGADGPDRIPESVVVEDDLEDDDGEHGPDRVDADALPTQDPGHVGPQPGLAQEWDDDGRAGDHHDGAEEHGRPRREATDGPRRHRPHQGGYRDPEREETHDHDAHAGEVAAS